MQLFKNYLNFSAPQQRKMQKCVSLFFLGQAVEEIFKVEVEKVYTITMKRKTKRVGYHVGKTAEWKKAIVKLTADSKTIEFFDSLM